MNTIRFDDLSFIIRLLLLLMWKSAHFLKVQWIKADFCIVSVAHNRYILNKLQLMHDKWNQRKRLHKTFMSVNVHFIATEILKRVQLLTCQSSHCLFNVVSNHWDWNYWFALNLTVENQSNKMNRLEFNQRSDLALKNHKEIW